MASPAAPLSAARGLAASASVATPAPSSSQSGRKGVKEMPGVAKTGVVHPPQYPALSTLASAAASEVLTGSAQALPPVLVEALAEQDTTSRGGQMQPADETVASIKGKQQQDGGILQSNIASSKASPVTACAPPTVEPVPLFEEAPAANAMALAASPSSSSLPQPSQPQGNQVSPAALRNAGHKYV